MTKHKTTYNSELTLAWLVGVGGFIEMFCGDDEPIYSFDDGRDDDFSIDNRFDLEYEGQQRSAYPHPDTTAFTDGAALLRVVAFRTPEEPATPHTAAWVNGVFESESLSSPSASLSAEEMLDPPSDEESDPYEADTQPDDGYAVDIELGDPTEWRVLRSGRRPRTHFRFHWD